MSRNERLRIYLDELRRYRTRLSWIGAKTEVVDLEHLERSLFHAVSLPYTFEGPGHYWFATTIPPMPRISGCDVIGTPLQLRCFMTLPTEVFVDGELVFAERYWTDFQMPEVTIASSYDGSSQSEVVIHVECTASLEATGEAMEVTLSSNAVEEVDFTIRGLLAELELLETLSEEFPQIEEYLAVANRMVDERFHEKMPPAELVTLIEAIHREIDGVREVSKRLRTRLIGHAHIDMNWLWPQEETERICLRDFKTVDALMDLEPDFRFTHSQAATYEMVGRMDPELLSRVTRRIAEGRWEIAASTWVEGDLNLVTGESIARQIRYARRYARTLGAEPPIFLWEPDTFGHPATMPQIMRRAGIEGYYHYRCAPDVPLYRWEGVDGSRVTAFSSIYLNPVDPEEIVRSSLSVWRGSRCPESVFVFGVGDHGGGPTAREIRRGRRLSEFPAMPDIEFGTMEGFYRDVSGFASRLPVVTGERNPVFDGCYTTHARTKWLHRRAEQALLDLERAQVLTGVSHQERTDGLWKRVMFSQFHDILCGCSIAATYESTDRDLASVIDTAEALTDRLLSRFACRDGADIEPEPVGETTGELPVRLRVWNLCGFPRTEAVAISRSPDPIDSQEIDGDRYAYVQTPGLSGLSLSECLQPAGPGGETGPESGDPVCVRRNRLVLTSEFFEIEIDRNSGIIHRLFDRRGGISHIEPAVWRDEKLNDRNNRFQIDYELPHAMSAWVIGSIASTRRLIRDAEVSVVADGPVMQVVRVEHRIGDSVIVERLICYRKLPWIDFEIEVDWHETGSAHADAPMLRYAVAPELTGNAISTWSIPFGTIERPNDGREYPALGWVDLSDDRQGFTLAFDAPHGIHIGGNTVTTTLLRSSYGPDPCPDVGTHRFRFRLAPHAGACNPAFAERLASALVSPLRLCGDMSNRDAHDRPWVTIDNPAVELSSLHPDVDTDDGVVVRLVEMEGESQRFALYFGNPIYAAEELLLGEDAVCEQLEISRHALAGTLSPHEIKSYRVRMSG